MGHTNGNAAHRFVDANAIGPIAEKTAFVEYDGRSISYVELGKQCDKLVNLYDRHSIKRDERAIMLVLDQIEFPIIFWGSLKAGVIPIPLNTLLGSDVYASIFSDSQASVLFVSKQLLPVVLPLLADSQTIKKVFVIGATASAQMLSFDVELALCQSGETVIAQPNDVAFWLYTSGSTGQPKGVRHIHSSLGFTADTYGDQVLGIRENDVVFSVAKMFFAYGLGNALSFPMSVGATTILLSDRPTPQLVLEVIERHTPTIFCGVPTLYAGLAQELDNGKVLAGITLRRCISAGEALPEEVGRRWQHHAGCEILDGVGSTEMLHIFVSNSPGEVVYGTSGVAVPGYELCIVDENNKEVSVGNIGELLVKGASTAIDYWRQPEKSRSTFEGNWTRTGDKYEVAEAGRLVYCGRTDDMFKVGGIWLSPFELEQALTAYPTVLEAAVVAKKDEQGLEKPMAFVVLRDGADDTDLAQILKDHVKAKIGKWKYPRWVEIVPELPKTATGKIQRFKLREITV